MGLQGENVTWLGAWQAITKLVPWWVRVAVIVALAAATWGAAKMRAHDERELGDAQQALARYKTDVAMAAEREQAEDARRAEESKALIAKLEKDHAEDLAARLAARDALWVRRRAAGAAREPLRLAAGACSDRPGLDRLADAFQRYRDGIGLALAEYRGRVRDLLRACEADGDRKADALAEVHDWAMQERKIYQPAQ